MQDFLNNILQSTEFPPLTAVLLGLLVAVNPCQIAICMSALTAFIQNDTDERRFMHNAWFFSAGRAALYVALAFLLVGVLRFTGSKLRDETLRVLTEGVESILPYALLTVGFFFLYRGFHKHHHSDSCHNSGNLIKRNKATGAFVLGMLLALLFCPESALLYFGMLIPMIAATGSLLSLLFFSLAAVAPLVMVAYICKMSLRKTNQIESKLDKIQVWINFISGGVLILLSFFLFFPG